MPRIRQCVCLKSFLSNFSEKYGTIPYTRRDQPVIFFGLFHQKLIDLIAQHKSLAVIAWVGSDAMYLRNGQLGLDYSKILHAPHVRHIAISKWIVDDLSACGVPHIYVPITHADPEKFKPVPLGNKVYYYHNSKRPILYGQAILDDVREKLSDIEFVITNDCYQHPPEEMPKLYSECFVGLRPTIHDGQSTTVAELGFMGRRCIHNGSSPNAIPWRTADDIVESIRQEQKRIGTIDFNLVKEVIKFTDVGENWLNTEFWGYEN